MFPTIGPLEDGHPLGRSVDSVGIIDPAGELHVRRLLPDCARVRGHDAAVFAAELGIEPEIGPGVVDVVALEKDVALICNERPFDVQEVLSSPQAVDDEPPSLSEDRAGPVHLPDQIRMDFGPGPLGRDF